MELREIVQQKLNQIRDQFLGRDFIIDGEIIFNNGECQLLTQSAKVFEFWISTSLEDCELRLIIDEEQIFPFMKNDRLEWDKISFAALLQLDHELCLLDPEEKIEHKKYTREGMIKRVLDERRQKAAKAQYRIKWADNIYGDHVLYNERGTRYKIFLRDFENETGYSDSEDAKINKLGTTKHIMFAFEMLRRDKALYRRLSKKFPFVEIYLDPLNGYKISWFYPHRLTSDIQLLISRYFGKESFIENDQIVGFMKFMEEATAHEGIVIRPEVSEKIEEVFENKMLEKIRQSNHIDYSSITATLFDYQKAGVEFAVFKKGAIIADEMGLGKTLQAITIALAKKEVFGFKHALIVCPASLKSQWKKEIERFCNEPALVVEGTPDERSIQYGRGDVYFKIVNYETVLRDRIEINKAGIDFLILDEAQRIKNFATQTAYSIKKIEKKHVLVITGTPIENKLIDLFSIMGIIDPHFLGPLWEFSFQHCLFDPAKPNKINGYYNLKSLNNKLASILLRREKKKVLEQLPNISQMDIPVGLTPEQGEYHASYAKGIASILSKKFITPYDMQRMQLLLANMRMVCNSTFLIDGETNFSPKLDELEFILLHKLDIKNSHRKVIIFSEWVKTHKLIAVLLRKHNIGFAELNGKVPVKKRGDLIARFENNPECRVFLSTEAGGSGLNLQMADILINFELPWNPAKKNQRIGRIDRLGQKSNKLTIINFITRDSIEMKIASGLLVKQNLFEGVLNGSSTTDEVDFSEKGRSQFLQELQGMIGELETYQPEETVEAVGESGSMVQGNEFEKSEDDIDEVKDDIPESENMPQEPKKTPVPQTVPVEEMEQVMNQGLGFLAGLYKMSTGKEIGLENQQINVNKETGEVTMRFKLPGF